MTAKAVHLRITGRVQGVGFRAWMSHAARRAGLSGWVRNRHDGSVEALVIGEEAAVERLVEASRRGPPMARVQSVTADPAPDDGSKDFAARPTV
jgi:acylphosphatase